MAKLNKPLEKNAEGPKWPKRQKKFKLTEFFKKKSENHQNAIETKFARKAQMVKKVELANRTKAPNGQDGQNDQAGQNGKRGQLDQNG